MQGAKVTHVRYLLIYSLLEKICKLVFTMIESEHDYTRRQPVACSNADGSKGPTAGVT